MDQIFVSYPAVPRGYDFERSRHGFRLAVLASCQDEGIDVGSVYFSDRQPTDPRLRAIVQDVIDTKSWKSII